MTTSTTPRPDIAVPHAAAPSPLRGSTPRPFRPRDVVLYALLAVALLIFVIPLYWLFTTSLKPNSDIYTYPVQWFPTALQWQNFAEAWNAAPMGRFFVNSVITTGVGTLLEMILAVMSAYAFAFVDFRWKKPVLLFVLGSMMLPGHVTLLVNYITVGNLGWINTYQGIILPGIGTAFAMFLLLQYMRRISSELIDAMTIDGAGHFFRLIHLILPLSRPMIITAGLIVLIGKWNEFVWPLIVTSTADMRTLPIGLTYLRSQEGYTNWGALMAGTVMTAAPMMIIFFAAQRRIIGGLAAGAMR